VTRGSPERWALVTGASGTLGGAIARLLAARGFSVLAHAGLHLERVEGLVDAIRAAGGQAQPVAFDVTDRERVAAILAALVEERGPIQAVVNNAGVYDDAPLAGMTPSQWDRVVDVSLHGFYNVTQPLLLPMIRTRWGRIVSISSLAAVTGNVGQVNYAAAKAGLHGATKALAKELASRGITVNAVAPGIIASPATAAAFPPSRIATMCPMQRAGTPEEVASLVGYLVSDDAAYLSGQIISVDGAMT
jgi:3-oxoacyl-[acyl-carrier protein] reductase